ncbi:uncharacterized protein LOC110977131 [Acanthaster planci]|uniref:Uncharacterized protein LOC110977131 n=1 Tax=Acanthaster planci TaxID=133434 RepID=A0A8B7Y2Y5_ACAPL|nr:uncharacterized protein LOC110977131 [Acanthaster planci]
MMDEAKVAEVNDENLRSAGAQGEQHDEDKHEELEPVEGEEADHDSAGNEEKEDRASDVGPCLFIGGLNAKTNESDLRKYFEKYGTVTECSITRKKGRDGKEGRSRGFGFITMATMAETEVILEDSHMIDDKMVSLNVSRPLDAPERKLRLCISNLDIEKTTEETLAARFSQFGSVSSCSIGKEQVNGKMVSRGLGFVTMATEEDVQAVLNACVNGRQTVDGKSVQVKRAVSDKQLNDKFRRLWFGGLDKDRTTEADIEDYFSAFGTVTSCVIIRDPPATEAGECKSKGYGFICMANIVETSAILNHQGPHRIHDKELVFNRVFHRPSRMHLESHPIKEIYVSGLRDTTLTMDDLRAYFNTHANVQYITMIRPEGAARILLDNAEDAEKLAQMHDHFIKRHWLTVSMVDQPSPLPQSEKQDPSKKHTAKLKQSFQKKGSGYKLNHPRGRGAPLRGSHPSQGTRPGQGGYGRGAMEDYYFEEEPSHFGPIRGRGISHHAPRGRIPGSGGGNTGGWVFVENLYGESEQDFYPKRPPKGFRGKQGRGRGYSDQGGGRFTDAAGLGGGYSDEWGETGPVNKRRGRGRGHSRGWPYDTRLPFIFTVFLGNMESEEDVVMNDGREQEFQEDDMQEGDVDSEKESDQDEVGDEGQSDGEEGDEDRDELDEEIEDPRKLFIGGLHAKTTEDDMKEHFGAYGMVESCVVAKDKSFANRKGKGSAAKGFGFVTMSSAEEAQAVLKDKHTLHGRSVAVTISKPLTAPERKLRLIVSHLDKEKTTEESLQAYFSRFGTVTSCTISKEEVEGRMVSRGFGFVTMALQEEVDTILSENSHGRQLIDGTEVEVKQVHVDLSRAKRRQIYVGNLDPEKTTKADLREYFSQFGPVQDLKMPRKGRDTQAADKAYAFVRMCNQEDYEKVIKSHEGEHEHKINDRVLDVRRAGIVENNEKLRKFYVGDLNKEKTAETDLKEYFGTFGTIVECTLVRETSEVEGQEGASKGYAFLLMSSIEEVDAILKHPKPHVLHEKELVVNRASPHTLHRAMITERITKMNVTNLKGSEITADDLREYFSRHTSIVSIELPVHRKTGKQLGFAVIELGSHHDVEKLAIMHEHYIRDHRCVVTKFRRKDAEQRAKLKKKERKKRQEANRGRGRGFPRGGGRGGGGPPRGGRGHPQWNRGGGQVRGRGRGRGGWRGGGGGGWDNFGEYGDGYYQGWESSCGPMRGFRGRGRGFGNHDRWGGGGFDGWGDGYADNGWRGGFGNGWGRGPRAPWRGRGGPRGRPY